MNFKRIVFSLAVLLFAAQVLAATVADRSPFTQGHWWDPERSGNGFEIFDASGEVMVIWYTFDDASRPVWYTAQGRLDALGTQDWPLLKHRWANGRKAGFDVVGSLRLTLKHAEGADVSWRIGEQRGTWAVQPFIVSGVLNEVDHSGSYFNPENSGWGFTVMQQGDVLGGVLYTYDASGAPTWVAGFDRSTGTSVNFVAASGACPACTYRETQRTAAGSAFFDFRGEREAIVRNQLSLPMAAGVNLDGARIVQLGRAASTRPADRQLAAFTTPGSLKAYLEAGMYNLQPVNGGVDFSAAPPGAAFSTTNLQEAGVDEADLVKTDGQYIYTFAHSNGRPTRNIRFARVGEDGGALQVLGTVALEPQSQDGVPNAGLYVHGGRLIAVTGSAPTYYGTSGWSQSTAWTQGKTYIDVLSATTPSNAPAPVWRAEIDGHLVSSRRIGQRLYVVSRFVPFVAGFAYSPALAAANRQILAGLAVEDLLPKARINGGTPSTAVQSASVFAPPQGARKPMADMILVTAIDLDGPRIAQSLAIVGTVDTVYVSSANLCAATSRYEYRTYYGSLLPYEPPYLSTEIHQVRLGTGSMEVVASGAVEGFLGGDVDKSAFRLSEHQGRLRAVSSTNTGMWGSVNRNRVTILEPSTIAPGLLKTVSFLPNAQRPESLGKPNELLYGTRFVDERLYAVTFRMTDPLYVVDLANVADPKIAGAVEVPGWSEYLHPLPNGVLLGVGKDATQTGFFQGLQLALFDVHDAATPREVQRVLIGKRGSDSALLRSHHAFSALMRSDGSGTLALPARIHDGPDYGFSDYPWVQSGLLRFEFLATSDGPRLVQRPSLITHRSGQGSIDSWQDPAVDGGRSVLFTNGTVYVGKGAFWRQDSAGSVFGPH